MQIAAVVAAASDAQVTAHSAEIVAIIGAVGLLAATALGLLVTRKGGDDSDELDDLRRRVTGLEQRERE